MDHAILSADLLETPDFRRPRRGPGIAIESRETMHKQFVFLAALAGALGSNAPKASAQAVDSISSINGQNFDSNAQLRYFNGRDCGLDPGAGPEDTIFELRLQNTDTTIGDVWLWTGLAGAECQLLNQRQLENAGLCAELAGNPRPIGVNYLVDGLTLQDLLAADAGPTDIVQCESSGLTGTPYQIFAFRNAPSGDVAAEGYGVAEFFVDVESPAAPLVDTSPQEASTFVINWANPNPPDEINAWQAWYSDSDDPSTAMATDIVARLADRSINIAASQLGLSEPGDTAYVFMQAYDQAVISNETLEQALAGNRSELSEPVELRLIDSGGVDAGVDAGEPPEPSGGLGGCSTSQAALPGQAVWLLALLFVLYFGRRSFV